MTAASSAVTDTSSPRRGGTRAGSSPWTQIVRGDSEGISSLPSPVVPPVSTSAATATATSSAIEQVVDSGPSAAVPAVYVPVEETAGECSDNGNAGAGKRPAWKKPSNGAAVAVEVAPVMGADSWPALSESTKTPGKPSESLKSSDGSSVSQPVSQGTPTASSSLSQRPANSPNMIPARQRSMKRNGGGNTSTNGGVSQPLAPLAPSVDMPDANHSPRDTTTQRSGFGSHSHNGNNHPQRNSFRYRNGGPHPRGDGSRHHNYGGRRDQDRGNQDWNAHRSFSGRDAHIHQHRVVPRFVAPPPPPPTSGPFMPPLSVRHFGSPMGFPELATPVYFVATPSPESLRGSVPFVAPIPPPAVFLHAPDFQLHDKIVNQIDYYFSNENLIKDTYLRQNMDDQGWVPLKLIAGFKKVKYLTENIQLISDAVQHSTVVEIQGDKVRRRNDWMKWIMLPVVPFPNRTNPQPAGLSGHDMLTGRVQGLYLEENATTNNSSARVQADFNAEPLLGESKAGEFNSQSKVSSTEGTGQVSVPAGSDPSVPGRN